ncbi:hypothetical protein DOTSEDRAFT_73647 [Dothistroma septosporum NZE10]|uniref:Uncharacterized protein n=1 Tax=Dothistroma septosporum (strain NZE10 / CBS 128990) TaxID=675120 RepID=N1PJ13_DOTSN|nr:hypothetical protein DOTSEDRAFT_73647 [Dothistroma septosporum NZE10]
MLCLILNHSQWQTLLRFGTRLYWISGVTGIACGRCMESGRMAPIFVSLAAESVDSSRKCMPIANRSRGSEMPTHRTRRLYEVDYHCIGAEYKSGAQHVVAGRLVTEDINYRWAFDASVDRMEVACSVIFANSDGSSCGERSELSRCGLQLVESIEHYFRLAFLQLMCAP